MFIVFTISAGLMLTLAIVNNGSSNDNHLVLSQLIIAKGQSPKYTDC